MECLDEPKAMNEGFDAPIVYSTCLSRSYLPAEEGTWLLASQRGASPREIEIKQQSNGCKLQPLLPVNTCKLAFLSQREGRREGRKVLPQRLLLMLLLNYLH